MKTILYLIPFFLGLSILTSCSSMSSLQTARTLDPGVSRSSFGGGVFQSGDMGELTKGASTEKVSIPYLEYTYRQGIKKDFDAGLKITIIGTAVLDGKYAFYQGDKFAAAVGAGLGYLSYSASSSTNSGGSDNKHEYKIIDAILPLYLSYDFAPRFSIYTSPRYVQRMISGASSTSTGLVGTTLGFKVGQESGVYLEGATFKDTKSSYTISQANISWFWKSIPWL